MRPLFEPIHDALKPVPLLDPEGVVYATLAILLTLSVLGVWWMWRLRRGRLRTPIGRAQQRLSKLDAGTLPPRALFEELHAILSEFLRGHGGFMASNRTSEEIAESLKAEGLEGLDEFLSQKDEARFAATAPDGVKGQRAVAQCRLLINRIDFFTARRRDAI